MATVGSVALVTGGARGIGVEVCRRLAADGHAVVVNYATSAEAARALVAEIEDTGGTARAVRADVADPDAVTAMFAEVAGTIGAPTILVNNAGYSAPASAIKMEPAAWDRIIGVNLSGAFYCTHAAPPAMYERGWGRVILLGSPGGGRTISAGMSAYAAAKAGLVAMGRAIALETARRGITVNTVVPGFVETDMSRGAGEEVLERMNATWPRIPPEAIAAMISFLVSPEADHVSGEDIAVWRSGPSPIVEPPRQAGSS